jgi:hypothetical protein
MAVSTRVARKPGSVTFEAPQARGRQLGFDEAMVGSPDEGSAAIQIDPSELAANPFLGTGEEDDDWDLPEDQRGKGKKADTNERIIRPNGDANEEDDGEEDDIRLAYDEDEGEEGGRERSSRRQRRNRSRRGAIDGRDQTIAELRDALNRQGAMIDRLNGGQFTQVARDIDQRLEYASNALKVADAQLAQAVSDGKGEDFAAINAERDKIAQSLWNLQGQKQRMVDYARDQAERGDAPPDMRGRGGQPQLTPEQRQMVEEQESEFGRMRDIFLDRYSWFDPDDARDRDAREVKAIDAEVAEDGYLRHTKAFWHEMEKRMREAGFRPETSRRSRRDEDFEEDDRPSRRSRRDEEDDRDRRPARRSGAPPTGAVRSTTRPGRGGAYQLDENEYKVLEEEGLTESNLSEADLAKRDRYINAWRTGKEQLRRANGGRR